jgi:hypothetical protein
VSLIAHGDPALQASPKSRGKLSSAARSQRVGHAPLGLGCVHRAVGVSEDHVDVDCGAVIQDDPAASTEVSRLQFADNLEEILSHSLGRLGLDVWEDHRELIATEAGDEIGHPQTVPERTGRADEHRITGLMAGAIVDLLEAVQVEYEHRSGLVVTARMRQPGRELLDKPPPVRD